MSFLSLRMLLLCHVNSQLFSAPSSFHYQYIALISPIESHSFTTVCLHIKSCHPFLMFPTTISQRRIASNCSFPNHPLWLLDIEIRSWERQALFKWPWNSSCLLLLCNVLPLAAQSLEFSHENTVLYPLLQEWIYVSVNGCFSWSL